MINIIYTTSEITEATFNGFEVQQYEPLTQQIVTEEMQAWIDNGWAFRTEQEAVDALEEGEKVVEYTREEFAAALAAGLNVELVD